VTDINAARLAAAAKGAPKRRGVWEVHAGATNGSNSALIGRLNFFAWKPLRIMSHLFSSFVQ
jgi:hypothetical protein